MPEIRWNEEKNEELKRTRGVSFAELISSTLVGVMAHPKRPNQRIMLFQFRDYIWVVPCVVNGDEIFLKTLFASRKFTKLWRKGGLQ